MTAEVTTELVFDDGESCGAGRFTVLRLTWGAQDPLAVRLLMVAQPSHPTLPRGQWVVLRDTLRAGLSKPSSAGGVHIEPSGDEVAFALNGGPRRYTAKVSRRRICDFLDDTDAVVPAGAESYENSLNAGLRQLLGRG